MKKPVLVTALLLFAASGHAAPESIDQTIPCEQGGNIVLTGTYDPVTSTLDAHLQAMQCVQRDGEYDSVTISGGCQVTGALPTMPGASVNLTVTLDGFSSTENTPDGYATFQCNGTMNIYGPIGFDYRLNLDWTSDIDCQGSGQQNIGMNDFINDLIFFDTFSF